MLSEVEARGTAIGRAARDRAVGRLAARVRDAAPEVGMTVTADGVTLTGRGVLDDPRLTWIGSLMR